MTKRQYAHFTGVALLILALLLPLGVVSVPQVAEAAFNPFGVADTKVISAKALTDHECDDSEWHFVITQVADEASAPASIEVHWADGSVETLPLDKFTGGTAHYSTTLHLDSQVVSATATIYASWSGQFNLSHGPCPSTPTPTATATKTATNTPTATPTSTATNTPTATPTSTAANTPTATPTSTATNTPTATPTKPIGTDPAPTPTATPTHTATATRTPTATPECPGIVPDPYETDNSGAQAKPIPVDGSPQSHNFHHKHDVDWIRFNATAGNEYVIETFGLFGGVDTMIALYGPDMTLLATNDDADGKASKIVFTAPATGVYFVKIYAKNVHLLQCNNGYRVRVTQFAPQGLCACVDWITFLSNRDGNWELYRMDIAGNNVIRLTNDAGVDMAPARSADGSWIAFQSNRAGAWNIYRIGAFGQDLLQLTANAGNNTDPVWTADCGSSQIAFQSDRDGNWEIYIMDENGNGQTRLTYDPAADEDPFWSPDGFHVIFQSNRNGNWDLYRVDITGTDLVQLTSERSDETDPVYSPDGRYIAFRSNREGQWNVYVMPAEGGAAVKVSGAGNNLNAVWSPDSRYLAYQSDRNGRNDIYVAEIASGTEVRVTDHPAADEAPAWDCNSSRVVFQSKRDENWNLYLVDITGKGTPVQLTSHPRIDAYPMWNPGEEDASRMGLGVLLGNR